MLIPAFTTMDLPFGECGKLPTFCSFEWKRNVFFRALKSYGYGDQKVQCWMGMSIDELQRLAASTRGWCDYVYPLVADVPMARTDCQSLLIRHGLPIKVSSECWMFPNQTKPQWARLQAEYPRDYSLACDLEESVRLMDDQIYFSEYGARNRILLRHIDWQKVSSNGLLFKNEGCSSGICGI